DIEQYRDCVEITRSQVPASLADIYHILDCHKIPRNALLKLMFCCSFERLPMVRQKKMKQ
ncbi:MAG TPA: hypothetical protein V6C71_11655, partial [Coleofasciculaceae cyanobacterium]